VKIVVKKQVLENVVAQLQPFVERKDMSHITSHIYLSAEPNKLLIKGTDNEIGLSIVIEEFTCEEAGTTTCNAKKFLDIVRILKSDEVSISTSEGLIHIKQGRSNYKLPTFNAHEYPEFPNAQTLPRVEINSLKLITAFKKIMPAVDTNNPKFELNGALIDIKNYTISIVSTDTKRLALLRIDNEAHENLSLIIPKKAIAEIQKLFFNEIELYYDNTNFIVRSGNYYFYTKVINGKFPDYERIIPRELRHNITLQKDRMIEAIKQVNIISSEIKMTFDGNTIHFESMSDENIEAKTEMVMESAIEERFTVAVNSRFIIDFLSQIDTTEFLISFNEPNTPFQLKSENFITIVMPIAL